VLLDLVERDDELARFRSWCDTAAGGRGRTVFIGGEPGIGKSALLHAALDDARGFGARVAIGRCDALSTPRSLGPFVEIAEQMGAAVAGDRDGLFTALLREFRSSSLCIIALEDAHWADGPSIELLGMLGRRAVDLPLVVIVTFRDHEIGADHPLRVVLGDLVSSGGTSLMTLRPLSIDAVATLAAANRTIDTAALHRVTGGNPFYVTEVLADDNAALPSTVRHAVLARASRLGADAGNVLDVVAVVPGRIEQWLLNAVLPDAGAAVAACITSGMLVAEVDHVWFRHELARLTIDSELSDDVRRDLHRRVAAELTERHADNARIAHHAIAAGDELAAAGASAEAAQAALATGGFEEAASHGQYAIGLGAFLDGDTVAIVQEVVARALAATSENDQAMQLAQEAAAHWHTIGNGRREAEALVTMAGAASGLGRASLALDAAGRAVNALEQVSPGRELAAAYVTMTELHMLNRDRDCAAEWGVKAAALSRLLGDFEWLGRALIQSAIADVMDGQLDAVEKIREGIGIGLHHDEAEVVSLGYRQLGSGFGELRRYDLAVPALLDGISWSADHGFEAHRRYDLAWLARCRFDLGDWPAAEALAREALSGSRSAGTTVFVALNTLGWLRARRGDDDVWPALDEALAIARQTGHLQRLWPVAVARAEAGWLAGDLDSHASLLHEVAAVASARRYPPALGELGAWLRRSGHGDVVAVESAAEPFASILRGDPLAASAGFLRIGCPYEAAMALVDTDATSSLRQALATFQRLGARPMSAIIADRLRIRGVRVGTSDDAAAPNVSPAVLSEREREVVRLVAAGFTNPQIASNLYISRKTAEHHVSNILVKLGVTTRTEAATMAVRLGIIDD
jgi:DNA-binding CsgD family transcriptional regulator/tetratricopeptide (TPR) repeat protein